MKGNRPILVYELLPPHICPLLVPVILGKKMYRRVGVLEYISSSRNGLAGFEHICFSCNDHLAGISLQSLQQEEEGGPILVAWPCVVRELR